MVQLGEGFAPTQLPKSRDELVIRGDLQAEVSAQVSELGKRLERLLLAQAPHEWPTPQVTVQAHVDAPVTVPAQEPPDDINVTMPGMQELRAEVAGLRSDIQQLCAVLMQPVTRTVVRDNGVITRITESR